MPQATPPSAVRRLLSPASIAIVGASDKVGPGFNAWRALEAMRYPGRVYLVNPHRATLLGQSTFSTLAAIPDPIDAAFIAVPREAVVGAVREAAAKGAAGATVLSSGFGEAGPDGVRLERELAAIARDRSMAVCGPNCLGFLNLAASSGLWGTSLPDVLPRGGVGAVVQSGSVGIALLNAGRGLGLACLITSGNEAVTTAADYLDALVDDPGVTVVIAFLEQLRKPREFAAAARRAAALGKPVIVVKSGRSERGRQAVMAHTGAVAGPDEVVDAALRAAGVIRAGSLDEMIETAVLVSTARTRPTARGVAVVSPSGGEIALALDIAEPAGLELPPVPAAEPELARLLPEFAHAGNPLDLTWAGLYDPAIARRCVELLAAEPAVGSLVLLHDAPRGLGEQQATRYANLLRAVAEGVTASGKPLTVVSNLAVDSHPAYEEVARSAGVPCLRGTQQGLFAVARFADWATARATPTVDVPPTTPAVHAEAARRLAALPRARAAAEHEAREVLAAYGVRGPREIVAGDAAEATKAAAAIGYPVVLKALVENVLHKTEHGLVAVGIRSDDDLRDAVLTLTARAERAGSVIGILVQELVAGVGELLVGGRVDADFGPIVVVGGGGVTVELYRDVAIRLAPVTIDTARAMLAGTRAARLLGGWRGRPPGDLEAAAHTVVAVSRLVADFRADLTEVEINPLAVLEDGRGAIALDAVIVTRDYARRTTT
ncbi:MAG: acetate--CoA ligase family protein [Candidatus Rokubacteria bacterium]|nr:acetate--CoA ligase family protein [Candidatus Rokubacteria bacterium]